ncbi:MAG: carboxypeptidase regulatory-like domain-containing protein [Bryobacteraceae bacterium]|nr:carboxypeptidase regulatory-like domain-containing protein [Bryobacteraceae bacterium]
MLQHALCRATVLVLTVFALAASVFAQSDNATISGIVKDPSGAPVANAKVSLRNESTSFERQANTNNDGFYTVTNIAPGYYTVTVEATGFKKATTTRNKLDAGVPIAVNVDLTLGQLTDTVTVEASASQVNTESATVGKTVEQAQIQNLTLNGRNPLFSALLRPGVRGGALSGFSFGLSSGGFTINGGRSQDSLITVDGAVAIRTRANGTSIGTADADTVQEVQILAANYSAEYGRSGNGQIRMVTRSGQKDFHGALYENFRNSALDANSWTRNRSPLTNFTAPFRFNQFGYNVSGPVMIPKVFNKEREKLFFLFAQEWVRFRQDVNNGGQRVPTAAMRNGNFSELLGSNLFYGSPRAIEDPSSGLPCTTTGASVGGPGCFPNNVIPVNRQSPNGMAFLRAYPAPNGIFPGNNNFFQVRPQPQNQRKDTVSIDYNPTSNQVVRFRHLNYAFDVANAFAAGFDFAPSALDRPNKTASLSHVWTLSPTLINEAMITASNDRVTIAVQRQGRFQRSVNNITYPYLFSDPKEIPDKIPTIVIPNTGTIDGGPYPSSSAGPIYTFSNNMTKIAGNHTFKFGVMFERSGQNDFDQINVNGVPGGTNNQNGRFEFNDVRPGAPGAGTGLANAALGLFSTYAEIGTRSFTPYRSNMVEFFGQDSWRVSQRLKLELGFRGTWQNGYYKSLWGNIAYFNPRNYDPAQAAVIDRATGNVLSGNRYNGVRIPGSGTPAAGKGRVPALDSGLFNNLFDGGSSYPSPNQMNFMPRLGLAYTLTSKQVIRVGFGGFVSRPGVYDSVFLGGNPPFQPMASVSNGNVDLPGGATRTAFPQFFMTIDPAYKIPLSYQWNATYQREIGYGTTVEVGYVGTVGNFLARERDLNQLPTGSTFRTENTTPSLANVNFQRPFKGFANIPMLEHSGRSTYHGLQLEVNRRFAKGLLYSFSYTLSKTMDNNSGPRDGFYDVYNQSLNWGKSANDTRHIAVASVVYELPFFKGGNSNRAVRAVAGGWQLMAVNQWQTGTPITIGNGDDYLGIGSPNFKPWNLNFAPSNSGRQFSNVTAAGNYVNEPNFYFPVTNGTTSLATRPANGTLPNQNRNSISFNNPGFQNWNLATTKSFNITERTRIVFRAEGFNWINHPNWGGVDTNPTAATFGKVTGKSSERTMQMSLRLQL